MSEHRPLLMRSNRLLGSALIEHNLVKFEDLESANERLLEIAASGDNITLGYWNDAEETARFFRNGRLFTGDMARVDRDGFIFIVERARDFIKAMGNRVSPKEIEEVLSQMPQVVEAAVIGVGWIGGLRAELVLPAA